MFWVLTFPFFHTSFFPHTTTIFPFSLAGLFSLSLSSSFSFCTSRKTHARYACIMPFHKSHTGIHSELLPKGKVHVPPSGLRLLQSLSRLCSHDNRCFCIIQLFIFCSPVMTVSAFTCILTLPAPTALLVLDAPKSMTSSHTSLCPCCLSPIFFSQSLWSMMDYIRWGTPLPYLCFTLEFQRFLWLLIPVCWAGPVCFDPGPGLTPPGTAAGLPGRTTPPLSGKRLAGTLFPACMQARENPPIQRVALHAPSAFSL